MCAVAVPVILICGGKPEVPVLALEPTSAVEDVSRDPAGVVGLFLCRDALEPSPCFFLAVSRILLKWLPIIGKTKPTPFYKQGGFCLAVIYQQP